MSFRQLVPFILAFSSLLNAAPFSDTLVIRAILDTNGLRNVPTRLVCKTNDSGRVTFLNLSPVALPSPIPKPFRMIPELAQLDELQNLKLSGLDLDAFPESILRFRGLIYLDVSYNEIPSLPESLGVLSELTHMNVGHNPITNFPASIWDMEKLDSLHFWGCKLASFPPGPPKYRGLDFADFSGNNLCAVPVSIQRWLNTFAGNYFWAETQGCPSGVAPPLGIHLLSHSFGRGETKDSAVQMKLGHDIGESVGALAEWEGKSHYFIVAKKRLPKSRDWTGEYSGNVSMAGFGPGAKTVDISLFSSHVDPSTLSAILDTGSVRAFFVQVEPPTLDLGPTIKDTPGAA